MNDFTKPDNKTQRLYLQLTDTSSYGILRSKVLDEAVLNAMFPRPIKYVEVWRLRRQEHLFFAWAPTPPSDDFVVEAEKKTCLDVSRWPMPALSVYPVLIHKPSSIFVLTIRVYVCPHPYTHVRRRSVCWPPPRRNRREWRKCAAFRRLGWWRPTRRPCRCSHVCRHSAHMTHPDSLPRGRRCGPTQARAGERGTPHNADPTHADPELNLRGL
jgi:hypothetical protein